MQLLTPALSTPTCVQPISSQRQRRRLRLWLARRSRRRRSGRSTCYAAMMVSWLESVRAQGCWAIAAWLQQGVVAGRSTPGLRALAFFCGWRWCATILAGMLAAPCWRCDDRRPCSLVLLIAIPLAAWPDCRCVRRVLPLLLRLRHHDGRLGRRGRARRGAGGRWEMDSGTWRSRC